MTRDQLLAALMVERYDNRWWPTPEPEPVEDDPITCRWRREIAEREHDRYESKRQMRRDAA
jgi:hypothetical protein